MITKTKHAYYSLEKRFGNPVKIKKNGYKITISGLSFFSEDEKHINKMTEATTGAGINVTEHNLEALENLIIKDYDFLKEKIETFKEEHPEYSLDQLEEWKD